MTLSIEVRSRGEINLFKLAMLVIVNGVEHQVRWTVEPHGSGYTYWSVMVLPKGEYSVTYNSAILGDATLTYREI